MIGLYIGRFQPLHIKHEAIINNLINDYGDNSVIIIGSAQILNEKNIFTFEERKNMINLVYPDYKNIYPLNDHFDDCVWRLHLNAIIYNKFNIEDESMVEVYCGCLYDVTFFEASGHKIKTFNRKINDESNISSTKIREAINNNDLEYIRKSTNPKIYNFIIEKWRKTQNEL